MKQRKFPQRMCVGCQQMKSKRELVRVVRTPEGELLLDDSGKKSGRGAYLCPEVACLQAAVKGKRLQRALAVDASKEAPPLSAENVPKAPTREDWTTILKQLELKIRALPPRASGEEGDM